jgi:hypothetical protein
MDNPKKINLIILQEEPIPGIMIHSADHVILTVHNPPETDPEKETEVDDGEEV